MLDGPIFGVATGTFPPAPCRFVSAILALLLVAALAEAGLSNTQSRIETAGLHVSVVAPKDDGAQKHADS